MNQEEKDCPTLKPYVDEYSSRLARINKLADLLDTKFVIPGTNIRFGWDGIIGLIPVAGDTLTLLPQLYLLYEAWRAKTGAGTIVRMLANVGIDWLLGTIPLLGDIFDIAFKSNVRNARLVAQRIREKQATDV